MYTIYTLTDPRNHEVFYVGASQVALKKRLKRHCDKRHENGSAKNLRILSIWNEGYRPLIDEIERVNDNEWMFWEQYWICQFRAWGANLTNIAAGGYSNTGVVAWNKGVKGSVKSNRTSFKKGSQIGKNTRFKKGTTIGKKTWFKKGGKPWNTGKKHSPESIKKMSVSSMGSISARRKLTEQEVKEIRQKFKPNHYTVPDLMKEYQVSRSTIQGIIYGKTYREIK